MAETAKNDPGQWKFIGIEGMNKILIIVQNLIFLQIWSCEFFKSMTVQHVFNEMCSVKFSTET